MPKLDKLVPKKQRVGFTGSTGLQLTVDDGGKITECTLRTSSPIAGMDDLACTAVRTGKYTIPRPILYREGRNPLAALILWKEGLGETRFATQRVRYPNVVPGKLLEVERGLGAAYPATALAAKAAGKATMEVAVDASGKVTHCLVVASTGNDALDIASCAQIERAEGLFLPGSNVFGQPVGGHMGGVDLDWKPGSLGVQ